MRERDDHAGAREGAPALAGAAAAFEALARGPAAELEAAFAAASASIGDHLETAAARGALSFQALAATVRDSLAGSVSETTGAGPLAAALGALTDGLFAGARAEGGPVTAGGAYLVGEQGPEVFTPAASGEVVAPRAPTVAVTMHFAAGADADSVRRSEAQISALIARAVARGQKQL